MVAAAPGLAAEAGRAGGDPLAAACALPGVEPAAAALPAAAAER